MRKNKYFSTICGGIMLFTILIADFFDESIAMTSTFGVIDADKLYEQYGTIGNFPGYPHMFYLPVVAMSLLAVIAVASIYILLKKQGHVKSLVLAKEIIVVSVVRCAMILFMLYSQWYIRIIHLDEFAPICTAVSFTDQYGFYVRFLRVVSYFIMLGLVVKDFIKIKQTKMTD